MTTLVHAYVGSRLDYYCNSALVGVSGQLLHKLQMIQNAAARIITGTRSTSGWSQFCVNLTGCQTDKGSLTRQLCRCIVHPRPGTIILCGIFSADVTLHWPFQPHIHQSASAACFTNYRKCYGEFLRQRASCVEQFTSWLAFIGLLIGHYERETEKPSFSELSAMCTFAVLANFRNTNYLIFYILAL